MVCHFPHERYLGPDRTECVTGLSCFQEQSNTRLGQVMIYLALIQSDLIQQVGSCLFINLLG